MADVPSHCLSTDSQAALSRLLSPLPQDVERTDWGRLAAELRGGPLAGDVESLRGALRQGSLLVLRLEPARLHRHAVWAQRATVRLLAHLLGEPVPQNEAGERVMYVYNRDFRDRKNPRYTQTARGGTLHTDGASSPTPWDCMLLSCLAPGLLGGESLLVRADRLHDFLARRFPSVLDTLQGDFPLRSMLFPTARYSAPVLRASADGLRACYLRPAIDAGAEAEGHTLTDAQLHALDVLDACLELPELTLRLRLEAGETLVALDDRLLHGRTAFCDAPGALPALEASADERRPLRRTMERFWVRF